MYKALTPDVFRHGAYLNREFHLTYNQRKKTLKLEKVVYYNKFRMTGVLKETYTYSKISFHEYDNLTFMDCEEKTKSDTHTSYKIAPYRS